MNTKSEAPLEGAEGISIDSEKRTITITSLPWFQSSNEAPANTTLIQSEIKLISIFKSSSNVTTILAPTSRLDLSGFL